MIKVSLTPSNTPAKLAQITRIDLEKSAKMLFQTLTMATISQGQGRLRSNWWSRCLLPIAIPLPSFAQISKIDFEKSIKMWIQTLKMAAISRGQGRSRKRCLLHLAMSLPSFVAITKIDWEKSAKMWFQTLKMATISRGQGFSEITFADEVPLTLSNVPTQFCLNNQKFLGRKLQKCDF